MKTISIKLVQSSGESFQIFLAVLGLFLILMLTLFPPISTENLALRKPLVGSIFISLCILGGIATILPTQCSKIIKKSKRNSNSTNDPIFLHSKSSNMQGHHPGCGNFNAHTFNIKSRIFCAACIGLFIGALVTTILSFFYFFVNLIVIENSILIVFLGTSGVGFGLFQHLFKGLIRFSLNFFFVLGSFFILIGIDRICQSLIIDLFVISLILFWLFTRISLSYWDHERICSNCQVVNCKFIN